MEWLILPRDLLITASRLSYTAGPHVAPQGRGTGPMTRGNPMVLTDWDHKDDPNLSKGWIFPFRGDRTQITWKESKSMPWLCSKVISSD